MRKALVTLAVISCLAAAAFAKLVFEAPDDREFTARASFGLAELEPGMTDSQLWESADQALYRAKAARLHRAASGH